MTGDPRVLAGLQQAYLAASERHLQGIRVTWRVITDNWIASNEQVGAEIRAWTPATDDAPDLAARVETLGANVEQQLLRIMESIVRHSDEIEDLKESLASMLRHPEPPAPAADLDPVRVEAAAKTAFERTGKRKWNNVGQDVRDVWIEDSKVYILAYLNGETR